MKNLIVSIMFLSLLFTSCSKDKDSEPIQGSCDFVDFLYYESGKFDLGELSNEYVLIGVDTTFNDNEIRNFISAEPQFDQNFDYNIRLNPDGLYKFKEIALKLNSPKSCEEITQLIFDLEQNSIVSYAHYTMQTDDCQDVFGWPMGELCINSYGSDFYLKVLDENDLTALNQMIAETNTELVSQDIFMPQWFVLRATKASNGDALTMANAFFESGLFASAEPRITKFPVE